MKALLYSIAIAALIAVITKRVREYRARTSRGE